MPKDPAAVRLGKLRAKVAAGGAHQTSRKQGGGASKDAQTLGARGGKKGGPARAQALTPKARSAIARKGAQARWSGQRKDEQGKSA